MLCFFIVQGHLKVKFLIKKISFIEKSFLSQRYYLFSSVYFRSLARYMDPHDPFIVQELGTCIYLYNKTVGHW